MVALFCCSWVNICLLCEKVNGSLLKRQQEKVKNLTHSERLGVLIDKLGLSQGEVAQRFFNVNRSYLNQLLHGKKPWSRKNIEAMEALERDQGLLEKFKENVSRDAPPAYTGSDLDWLLDHGFGPEVKEQLRLLRRALEKRSTQEPNSISDAEASAAIEAAEKQLQEDEMKNRPLRPSAAQPTAQKPAPSQPGVRRVNPRPGEPDGDPKKSHN